METTRHFTATAYLVHDGATALHRHPRLGIRIPPGGHLDRDELPHEAALREAREETGLAPTLVDDTDGVAAPAGESLPDPRHTMLYDINVHGDGSVGHQHVDFVFFASVEHRDVDPAGSDEAPADAWSWYTPADLRADDLDGDTVEIGLEAIDAVESSLSR
ncbi:NUDIX hydrolase [Halobaculum sp. D14]|uniref:NUDIX hydrolase n=1 Tax=Halobaculum sp. D14 TaxID=3421642 RepID=UPI003EC0B603